MPVKTIKLAEKFTLIKYVSLEFLTLTDFIKLILIICEIKISQNRCKPEKFFCKGMVHSSCIKFKCVQLTQTNGKELPNFLTLSMAGGG